MSEKPGLPSRFAIVLKSLGFAISIVGATLSIVFAVAFAKDLLVGQGLASVATVSPTPSAPPTPTVTATPAATRTAPPTYTPGPTPMMPGDVVESPLLSDTLLPEEVSQYLMQSERNLQDMSNRLAALETTLLDEPGKAVEIALLRNDIEDFRASQERELAELQDDYRREIDNLRGQVTLLVGALLAAVIPGVVRDVSNTLSRDKKDEG